MSERQVRHIEALRSAGYSVKRIVADLGVSRASVYHALVLASTSSSDSPEPPAPD